MSHSPDKTLLGTQYLPDETHNMITGEGHNRDGSSLIEPKEHMGD